MIGKSHTRACDTSKHLALHFVPEFVATIGLASSMLTKVTKNVSKSGRNWSIG